jgi:hypothetical protein
MTTAPRLAVVATQLAQTDRRALSQAWYSALHLARRETPAMRAPSRTAAGTARVATPPPAAAPSDGPHGGRAARVPVHRAIASGPRVALERRSVPTDLARRLERAVERAVRTTYRRTSQTIAVDGGRVTVLVRSEPGATRIVALCGEPVREAVERALAHARFALAARGYAVLAP